jgi:hypothetical protein
MPSAIKIKCLADAILQVCIVELYASCKLDSAVLATYLNMKCEDFGTVSSPAVGVPNITKCAKLEIYLNCHQEMNVKAYVYLKVYRAKRYKKHICVKNVNLNDLCAI